MTTQQIPSKYSVGDLVGEPYSLCVLCLYPYESRAGSLFLGAHCAQLSQKPPVRSEVRGADYVGGINPLNLQLLGGLFPMILVLQFLENTSLS